MFRSAGSRFKMALSQEKPLQMAGVINPITALLAREAGFKSLYLSGAGFSNANLGLPDLALSSLTEVAEATRRITSIVELPLLVDADTGWGSLVNVQRTIHELECAGAAGVHLEDQSWPKRCGHHSEKKLVSPQEMVDRIKAAVDSKKNKDFVIMARTDAYSAEGMAGALERLQDYMKAGADMLFVEALTTLEEYQTCVKSLTLPILANITEFGKTPLFSVKDLANVGVQIVLYPMTALRAMNKTALHVYQTLKREGSQAALLPDMQTREELYRLIRYEEFASKINKD